MICIFLPTEQLTSEQITITGEQAKHLSVLRIKPGELIQIFDGIGHRYISKVIKSCRKEVSVEILKEEVYSAESPLSIILAQGVPKGEKMDFIIQKSTELGVKKIIPLISERSQIRYTAKAERWRKIAASASQQSGRGEIPEIESPISLSEFLKPPILPLTKGGKGGLLRIIFSEEEKKQNLKKVLKNFQDITNIIILIGPEGGFSPAELTLATNGGFTPASLGPRILRTETAAITAISIIQYELGDMG